MSHSSTRGRVVANWMVGGAVLVAAGCAATPAPTSTPSVDLPSSQPAASSIQDTALANDAEPEPEPEPELEPYVAPEGPPPDADVPVAAAPSPSGIPTMGTAFKVGADGQLMLPGPVLFQTGRARLAAESDAVLEIVHRYLVANPDVTMLRIESHSDSMGASSYNLALTRKRAMSVAQYLVAKGVGCRRLLPTGFGQTKPIAPNTTPQGRAMNRRVSFHTAAVRGRAVGGLPLDGGGAISGDPCNP